MWTRSAFGALVMVGILCLWGRGAYGGQEFPVVRMSPACGGSKFAVVRIIDAVSFLRNVKNWPDGSWSRQNFISTAKTEPSDSNSFDMLFFVIVGWGLS